MVRRNLKIIIICLVILAGLGAAFVVTRSSEGNRSPAANNQPAQSAPTNTKTETSTVDKITINNIDYQIHFTNNQTAQALKDLFPLEITMNDLNANEKYFYLSQTLPSDPSNPGRINAGDIMLFGNDCLVLFYKSFDTNYSYTKIGHIENLPDLGSGAIKVTLGR